jgi:hypothetical protein
VVILYCLGDKNKGKKSVHIQYRCVFFLSPESFDPELVNGVQ